MRLPLLTKAGQPTVRSIRTTPPWTAAVSFQLSVAAYAHCVLGLINGAWLGSIVLAFLWIVLAFYVFIQTRKDIYENDYDSYDFKADVPMAMGSPVAPLRGYDGSGVQVSPAAYAAGTEHSNYNYYQYPDYYEDNGYRTGSPFRHSTGTPPPPGSPSNVRRNSGFNYPAPGPPTAAEKTAVPDTPISDGRSYSEPPHSHDGSRA